MTSTACSWRTTGGSGSCWPRLASGCARAASYPASNSGGNSGAVPLDARDDGQVERRRERRGASPAETSERHHRPGRRDDGGDQLQTAVTRGSSARPRSWVSADADLRQFPFLTVHAKGVHPSRARRDAAFPPPSRRPRGRGYAAGDAAMPLVSARDRTPDRRGDSTKFATDTISSSSSARRRPVRSRRSGPGGREEPG